MGFQKSSCSLQLWKQTQAFIILINTTYNTFLFHPPISKHSKRSKSIELYPNAMTLSIAGPIEMPCQIWIASVCGVFLNSAEIPFIEANIQSFSTDAERLCESLGHHGDARLVACGSSQKLYIGCTYLMPIILKRPANAAVSVLSLHTTQVVDFHGHLGFMVRTNCVGHFQKKNISHWTSGTFEHQVRPRWSGQGDAIWCESIAGYFH